MYKETNVALIPKEELAFLNDDDNGFVKYIIKQLSQGLSDKLLTILDKENEIIVKQSELMVNDYMPTNSVGYRRNIEWCPLVRCKDCKHYIKHDKRCGLLNHGMKVDDFCSEGERKDNA